MGQITIMMPVMDLNALHNSFIFAMLVIKIGMSN